METLYIWLGLLDAVLVTVTAVKWKDLKIVGKIGLVLTTLSLCFGAYVSYEKHVQDELLKKITASFGDLDDGTAATIPKIGLGFIADAPLIISPSNGVLTFNHTPFLKVSVKNNLLLVSVVLNDSLGHPILAVLNNEWTKYSDSYEFNNDPSAIELVTKGDRKVFFHLIFVKGIVYVEGTIYLSKNSGVNIFTTDKFGGYAILGPGDVPNNDRAHRIFKYPRERYVGIRDADSKPF